MSTLEQMYGEDRVGLMGEALRLLSNSAENPGSIGVIAFLVRKRELVPLLRQAETPLASRILVAQLGQRVDSNLDHLIADQILNNFGPADRQDLLEILSQTRVRLEVISRLAPVLRDPDPRVHSKMAFLMARVAPEGEWVAEEIANADPRVRANVVEALWNQKSEFASQLFHRAAEDPHHRVSANAIYGLYLQGDPAALGKIRHLLLGSDGLARRAGLWLAERTKDPRYLALLGKLIGKVEPEARGRCLRVIQAAKGRKEEALRRGGLVIDWLPGRPGQARLTITGSKPRRLIGLHPFDLVIHARGQVLDDYRLVARPAGPARTVVLMLGECPDWQTVWRHAPAGTGSTGTGSIGTGLAGAAEDRFGYLHVEPAPEIKAITDPAKATFQMLGVQVATGKPDVSGKGVARVAPPVCVTWCGTALPALRRACERSRQGIATWSAAMKQVATEVDTKLSEAHVVLFDQLGAFTDQDVRALAELTKDITLNVISGAPHAGLAAHCEETGGRYQVAATADEAARQLGQLHRYWQADYEVTHPPTPRIDGIEVCCDWGYGTVDLS